MICQIVYYLFSEHKMGECERERKKERKKEWDRVYESRVNESKRKRGYVSYAWERANEQINMKQITVIDFAWDEKACFVHIG